MKIGTIGTGQIVREILAGAAAAEGVSCGAVYSRKAETGRALAGEFGVERVYTDLESFLRNPELDLIYIASPNSLHAGQARLALEHGKHVWLEKPFTPTLREAEELFSLAEERGLFLLEAITTQSLPNYKTLRELLPQVGQVRIVQCSYSQYSSRYDALLAGQTPNVFNPDFAGGALMDINLYNLSFVVSLFGRPLEAAYYANRHSNGVDTSGVLVLRYPGFVCTCQGAKDTWGVNAAQIQGEGGFLYVKDGCNWFSQVTLETREGRENFNSQDPARHWHYEVLELAELVRSGDQAEYQRRKALTLGVTEVLDQVRRPHPASGRPISPCGSAPS